VITLGNPEARATAAQAITPAAGPDNAVRTGTSHAVSRDMTPPLLWTISNSPEKPSLRKSSYNLAK